MSWFVQIGILILGYLANRAIAAYIQSRQKPPLPGPFQAPTIAPGQAIPVSYGTVRGEAVCAGLYEAKLVEVNLDTLDNITRIGKHQTIGYQYKITALFVLGWGHITQIANVTFGDRSLADQALTQPWDFGNGVTLNVPTFNMAGEYNFIVAGDHVGPQGGNIEIYGGGRAIATIFLPNIFGGRGRGGGFSAIGGDINQPYGGTLRFYLGNRQTGPDEKLVAKLGAGNVPNWNDLCYIVFDDVNVGEGTIPPSIEWIYYREPAAIDSRVNVRNIQGRYWAWRMQDMNPAAIVYDILRNSQYGLDQPAHHIQRADYSLSRGLSGDFVDAGAALAAEGLGMSMRFAGDRQGAENAIKEIERTVDGVLTRDPVTFKWRFKLIRDEATTTDEFNNLRAFTNEQLISLTPLNQQLWSETFNVVTVEFSDAERFFNKNAVTLRNDANIAMTGGERAAPNIQYFGITDLATARRLGARDLKKLSLPLWKGQMKTSRNGWDLERGDVFKLTYDKYEFSQKLFRVMAVDFGDEANGTITADIMEDVFHYADIVRPESIPDVPAGTQPIVRPVITSAIQSFPTPNSGRQTINLLDAEHRTYEIAYRITLSSGTPTAWIVINTATPITAPPFPYSNPVTDTDLNGLHTFDAFLSPIGITVIDVRIRYITYGTAADPTSGFGEILQSYPFPMLSQIPTQGTLDGTANPIIWDVTGLTNDSKNTTISGNRSLIIVGATSGFRGKLLITSTGAGGYTFTLPPGSIYGDGSSLDVTLGLKDQLSVYFDGTYYWWNLDTHATTLPPVALDATLNVRVTLAADFRGMEATLTIDGTTTGDLSV